MSKPKPNTISADVDRWRKAYKFLPPNLRDFHNQKDLFKTIHESMDMSCEYIKDMNFMQAQIYVVDYFLWFMARHGYTLQKSRQKLNFNDLEETLKFYDDKRSEVFLKMLEDLKNE